MESYLPYLLGILGGAGVLCAWWGIRAVRNEEATTTERRVGLLIVNLGIIMVAASLYLTTQMK